jgi:hypothetical protein
MWVPFARRLPGVVELGIHGKAALLLALEALGRRKPAVACSVSARWVEPKLFCTVRHGGWRLGGVWRDAVLAGWQE